MTTLTLTTPDDFHVHLRDGSALSRTVNDTARVFQRAIVMPNLVPPITTVELAEAYRIRILEALHKDLKFEPLMTLYLTQNTSLKEVESAIAHPHVYAFKLYPAGATTNSAAGVTNFQSLYPVFTALQKGGMPLLIHGEVTNPTVDVFDREAYFIDQQLIPLQKDFPALKIVLEHISTKEAVDYIESADSLTTAATITAHHLLYDRNAIFTGGIKPHFYCLPILKRRTHQEALIKAAISGKRQFLLGTDSAPHTLQRKESACGCAGIYTAYSALELYAEVFEQAGALDKLENFASHFGSDFYGLPRNQGTITLKKENWKLPEWLKFGDAGEYVAPLRGGEILDWKVCV